MSKMNASKDSLKKSESHGVIGRAIEDWLAKASERGYQTAFCHLLNAMGYHVIHSTTHGPAEEGKDVIAKDSAGNVYAIQLKRGNINVSDWRSMKPEIQELTELPINHPSVRAGSRHVPLLVTTGYIHENVASRIIGMNKQLVARKYRPLVTWAGSQLLMDFVRNTGGFLPQPLNEFHRLLGFMINTGEGPLNKSEFDLLMRSILPLEVNSRNATPKAIARSIAASTIIVEYALGAYDRKGNFYAKLEAYVMLFCYIRALAIRHRLPEKHWRSSVELLESTLDSCVNGLMEDFRHSSGFGQGDPLTDPFVAPYRNTLFAGVLAAHGIWCSLGGASAWYGDCSHEVIDAVAKLSKDARLASEGFVPPRFLASTYLRHNGHVKLGQGIFAQLLHLAVLRKEDKANVRPLWDAYLPLEEAMLREWGKKQDAIFPDPWDTETSTAYPLILVAAARLMKEQLRSLWYSITSLHFTNFVPSKPYEDLLWHNEKGKMMQWVARQPQPWEELIHEAKTGGSVPYYFQGYERWIPYYLMVYPHRFAPSIVLALEGLLNGENQR